MMATDSTLLGQVDTDQLPYVDRVELKLVIPDHEHGAALGALGIALPMAASQQVYYIDTPDLALLARGVVLRARRRPQGGHDTSVKLRPVAPAEIPREWRHRSGFAVEIDLAPGMSVCSASLKQGRSRSRLHAALGGKRSLGELFSKRQRALIAERIPGKVDWTSLRAFGPVDVVKATTRVPLLGPLVNELWRYPDGSSLLELSTRVRPQDLQERSGRLSAFLVELGLDAATEQTTKTERTLTFFAGPAIVRSSRDPQPARHGIVTSHAIS
jgi:hypothetical protein